MVIRKGLVVSMASERCLVGRARTSEQPGRTTPGWSTVNAKALSKTDLQSAHDVEEGGEQHQPVETGRRVNSEKQCGSRSDQPHSSSKVLVLL